ncbi:glycosyltransferase 87 family protein [Streptomyces sp. V3I8]|uniref:glycosyltransferase 87 family protein n=1 Tax=Streptomyces sp. V3I8 TaxID=3042279 RepID=UPI0027D8C529|nr:glycosyltransferase 87 family protein [Streptomyces sp. V3I8]
MAGAGGPRFPYVLPAVWALTRLALLLFVLKVFVFPGPDVTSDVAVTYRNWYEVLRTGTFPLNDVTWQYPPAAALAILSPALLPFLAYPQAFFVLALVADLVVLSLLRYAGRRPDRSPRGAWVWVVGVPLLGPTVYARYDVMVTAVAVAAVLAGVRHPKVMGVLAAFGALLKVWPLLLLVGTTGRRAWGAAAATAAGVALAFAALMPGAFAFLTFQRDRGTEVESLGSLVFHIARHHGWQGEVLLNYGSVEFLGPYVDVVSTVALMLTGLAFGWLLLWRLCATRFLVHTPADAAFMAVLLFTTTSRVISPQYLVWLVGLAAVCLVFRGSRMGLPAGMVLAASFFTVLEFPLYFADVVASTGLGITLLVVRNGLLVAATVTAGVLLWRDTVSYADPDPDPDRAPSGATPADEESLTS